MRNVVSMEIHVQRPGLTPSELARGPFVWPNTDSNESRATLVRVVMDIFDPEHGTATTFTEQYILPPLSEF